MRPDLARAAARAAAGHESKGWTEAANMLRQVLRKHGHCAYCGARHRAER